MKNLFTIITFFGVFVLLNSCKKEQAGFEIVGKITGFAGNSKVMLIENPDGKILDSTRLKDNKFVLSGKLPGLPSYLSLEIKSEHEQIGASTFIFIGNEKVSITGDREDFESGLMILGSTYNKVKSAFDGKVRPLENERKEKLQQMFTLREQGKWSDSLQTRFWSENGIITKIDEQFLEKTKEFISQNTNSHYALYQLVSNKNILSKSFIQEQIDKLNPNFKNSEYVRVLDTFLDNEPLTKDDRFYDFEAENQEGQIIKFSDLFVNKYVLLEFYTPYCSWCLKALPEIKKMAKAKKDSLEVVSFNINNDKKAWLEDYETKGLEWTSLWSEKGRYSYAHTKYDVYGTPSYFLFDKNGILVGKWEGFDAKTIEGISALLE